MRLEDARIEIRHSAHANETRVMVKSFTRPSMICRVANRDSESNENHRLEQTQAKRRRCAQALIILH